MDFYHNGNSVDDELLVKKHVNFLKRCLLVCNPALTTLDVSRMTIAFFSISGIDLLKSLDQIEDNKEKMINWIYSLQVESNIRTKSSGFRGSLANGINNKYDFGNLAMTYCALASLIILGDDLSRINKKEIVKGLQDLQQNDGSFIPVIYEKESDMRFVYCAATVCYILQDWSGINVDKMISFIKKSLSFEGAFGQAPGLEAHGGSTFCAIASLCLADKLGSTLSKQQLRKLKRWCVLKQYDGFQGRPNKDCDTCYSFWIGATLKLLNAYELVNHTKNKRFILSTQDNITGGFAKYPDSIPDPLHTYLGLSGLSLDAWDNSLHLVHAALNISERAVLHLTRLHSSWKDKQFQTKLDSS